MTSYGILLDLMPDPRLTEVQANVVEHDYGMEKGTLTIPTNAPSREIIRHFDPSSNT